MNSLINQEKLSKKNINILLLLVLLSSCCKKSSNITNRVLYETKGILISYSFSEEPYFYPTNSEDIEEFIKQDTLKGYIVHGLTKDQEAIIKSCSKPLLIDDIKDSLNGFYTELKYTGRMKTRSNEWFENNSMFLNGTRVIFLHTISDANFIKFIPIDCENYPRWK